MYIFVPTRPSPPVLTCSRVTFSVRTNLPISSASQATVKGTANIAQSKPEVYRVVSGRLIIPSLFGDEFGKPGSCRLGICSRQ